jgi:hypothetical protein
MESLEKRIFEIEENFDEIALEVFEFQYKNCQVYRDFVNTLNKKLPEKVEKIPFLPISFFKTHKICSSKLKEKFVFKSSGTGQSGRSTHFVYSPEMYEKSFFKTYQHFAGNIQDQVILALLPNYIEQGESSLVYMVDYLIQKTENSLSGFYKDDVENLLKNYHLALKNGKKVVIFGVSYALLDLAELKPDLSQALIIETGGMKGRRKELIKSELHEILKKSFSSDYISSEYGMTELFSQAYSDKNELFSLPKWMKIFIRDTNDPFHILENSKTGGINVIDLANLYSCSFISTQDLGQIQNNSLKLMGRFDFADVRGCNLMME